MKKIWLLLCLAILICAMGTCITANCYAYASNDVNSIKTTLLRFLCFEVYWELADRPNSTLPVRIRIVDGKFRIWINDFRVQHKAHMAGYFVGVLRNGNAVITKHEAYNSQLRPAPPPEYVRHRAEFDNSDVIEDVLFFPSDCTPSYDPLSSRKDAMLKSIVGTVQKNLSNLARIDTVKYPRELTLIIADFNIDYPSTYIFVEETKKLYSVTFHNPRDYESNEYERNNDYPFGEIYRKNRSLQTKIRRHGIVRKIILD